MLTTNGVTKSRMKELALDIWNGRILRGAQRTIYYTTNTHKFRSNQNMHCRNRCVTYHLKSNSFLNRWGRTATPINLPLTKVLASRNSLWGSRYRTIAIVNSFKVWHHYLEGPLKAVIVYSDHPKLEYYTTSKVLNRRQAHWAQELAAYGLKIVYCPGSPNRNLDSLSQYPEYCTEKGWGEDPPITTILSPNIFH
jgi:hypothetical protein